jgi:hypothetical protein
VRDFFTNGGRCAVVVRLLAPGAVDDPAGAPLTASDIVGAGLKASAAGLYALDTVDEINLLVIHPHAPDGSVDPIVVRAAEEYCRERHAVLLLDSPPSWTSAQDVLAAHEAGPDAVVGASGANVALIFPRLGDGLSATGAVAGVIARTDARTGVWGSPAGSRPC